MSAPAASTAVSGVEAAPLAERLLGLEAMLARTVALVDAEGLLPRASEPGSGLSVAGQTEARLDDYVFARDLVRALRGRLGALTEEERERLELNADLPQLAFHLGEELARLPNTGRADRGAWARSLTFLKRHIVRLRQEHVERRHTRLPEAERRLLLGLARLSAATFRRRFAPAYRAIGYQRPFVDKFYRDYALDGVPDGLLLELAEVARRDDYDLYVCVLKGGLTYGLLLELCGLPPGKLRHAMCGRSSGSHFETAYVFHPVDFALEDVRGRSVLLIENNVATGQTLRRLVEALGAGGPRAIGLFLDYVLPDVAGVSPERLEAVAGCRFHARHVGPYAARRADAAEEVAGLRRQLLEAVTQRLTPTSP